MGELADNMIDGGSCSWCGIEFRENHGFPVICQYCYNEWKKENSKEHTTKTLLQKFALQLAFEKEV